MASALFIWLLIGRVDPEQVMFVADALAAYAAIVAGALGALPWGLTMRVGLRAQDSPPSRRALWWTVSCVTAAWVGTLMPAHAGLVVLGVVLIGSYLADRKLYPVLHAQGWLQLRFRLTVVASLSCFLAAAQL